jgi:hypothetical protein
MMVSLPERRERERDIVPTGKEGFIWYIDGSRTNKGYMAAA